MRFRRIVSFALVAVAIVGLAVLVVAWLRRWSDEVSISAIVSLAAGVALAFLLDLRVPENRMSFLLSLIVLAGTLLELQGVVADWALGNDETIPAIIASQVGSGIWLLLFVSLFVLLPLWFPTGRAISPRWEWVWKVAVTGIVLAYLPSILAETTCIDTGPDNGPCLQSVENPWGILGLSDEAFVPLFVVSMAMAIPAVLSLVLRFRRARGSERQQLRWLAASCVLLVLTWAFSIEELQDLLGLEFGPWYQTLIDVALGAVLVSIGLAVLRYRLYDIDRILSRSVSYSLVVGILGVVFAAGVVVIPNRLMGGEASPLVVAASTLLVAALFNPLRRSVQSLVDRRFNRSRYDAERVMDDFIGSLRDRVDPDRVVDGWVGVVSETMQPESVGVWLRS